MTNDSLLSLWGNLAPFSKKKERKREKEIFVFCGRKRYFFFKSEKRLLTDGQKGDKKKSRKREKHRNR